MEEEIDISLDDSDDTNKMQLPDNKIKGTL